MDWQPIETAPKDGTELLGWRPDAGTLLIRWTAPAHFLTDSELDKLDEETAFEEGWFYADFVCGGRLDEAPLLWTQLPNPVRLPIQNVPILDRVPE